MNKNTKEYRKKAAKVNKMKQYSEAVKDFNREKSFKPRRPQERKISKQDVMRAYADNIQKPWERDFEDPYDSVLKQSGGLSDIGFLPEYDPASNPNRVAPSPDDEDTID